MARWTGRADASPYRPLPAAAPAPPRRALPGGGGGSTTAAMGRPSTGVPTGCCTTRRPGATCCGAAVDPIVGGLLAVVPRLGIVVTASGAWPLPRVLADAAVTVPGRDDWYGARRRSADLAAIPVGLARSPGRLAPARRRCCACTAGGPRLLLAPDPRRRAGPAGRRSSPRPAPTPSTRRPPSCAGSSATCTTAPRPGWSRSGMTLGAVEQLHRHATRRRPASCWPQARESRGHGPGRAARPGPRHPPAGAGRTRPRRRGPGAGAGHARCRSTVTVDLPGRLPPRRWSRPPTSRSPRRWPTRPGTPARRRSRSCCARTTALLRIDGHRRRPRRRRPARGTGLRGHRAPARYVRRHLAVQQPAGRPDHRDDGAAVRVVLAEDLYLLRDGPDPAAAGARLRRRRRRRERARAARRRCSSTGPTSPSSTYGCRRPSPTRACRPRWPPAGRCPGLPVLVLSQHVEQLYARELLADGAGGVGYLLKDRVFNADQFVDAVRRVAAGGTAMDPEVIAQAARPAARREPLDRLTAARAGGAGADGRGPLQRRDRAAAVHQRERRRQAHRRASSPSSACPRPTTTTAASSPSSPTSTPRAPPEPRPG